MICLDTNFLIALWRSRGSSEHPASATLSAYPDQLLVVCIPIAGEFLEGAAIVSEARFREAVRYLHLYEIRQMDMEIAGRYAHVVADLRGRNRLKGASKADLWLAAWALYHGAKLASQNIKHFKHIDNLDLISY